MFISCKKCQIPRCTHVAFLASVQMDSPGEEVIPPSESEEEFSDSNLNIGYYEPPPFPSDIDSDLSEDSNDITNENDDIHGPNSYNL